MSTTHDGACTLSVFIAERQAAVNTSLCTSLWFDPAENRTTAYRFSSIRSIHLTTDLFLYKLSSHVHNINFFGKPRRHNLSMLRSKPYAECNTIRKKITRTNWPLQLFQ